MALQSVGAIPVAPPRLKSPAYDHALHTRNAGIGTKTPAGSGPTSTAQVSTEYYVASRFAVEYTSQDGDKVSFSYESVEYQKAMLSVSGDANEVKGLVSFMEDQFRTLKSDLFESLANALGAKVDDTDTVEGSEEPGKPLVPEYWNAEQTSQRIVSFALSFSGGFQGKGDDFLKQITQAIEEGFKQARDILGDLPESVSLLVDDTYKLVHDKLNQWAATHTAADDEPGKAA